MPTDVASLQSRYQALLAPGNNAEFFRLLNEADERLLFSGRWHWVREPLVLAVTDSMIELSASYHSIVGARINGKGVGVNWQESEWFEGGPGEFIPIDGASMFLVDQGLVAGVRTYKLTSSNEDITEVEVLARFKPGTINSADDSARCPLPSALKQMMYSVVYEESNDTKLSEEYRSKALRELAEHEAAHRGIAKRIFKPSMSRPVRRRSRSNFP